mmetsp:Transcript_100373/g.255398  ORF Transcript_100373/g.255398 Transcript_100373/m.255398 type:complete len:383 (-) Transcript_100373:60-1208(-)
MEDEGLTHDATLAWAVFWIVFLGLAAFDLLCLAPRSRSAAGDGAVSGRLALLHVGFWVCIGLVFNAGIFAFYGTRVGIIWFNGYILEYLLSMDNVFFFHVVFKTYATPAGQVYKALFLGIIGAVVLRFAFYIVGAEFFRLAFVVQIFFGLVLVYSGYKTAVSDEDDEDPRENRCVKLITRCLPLTEAYDDDGRLFARVRVSGAPSEPDVQVLGSLEVGDDAPDRHNSDASPEGADMRMAWRGTLLLLVVIVLQVVDIIFAVDSVTAKIAEHDSTFVNFSSSAFAMLCLRSLYFVLTRLLKYFRFLKYGVAAILVLIGLKLVISRWYKLKETYSLAIICGVFLLSIVLSALCPAPEAYSQQQDDRTEMSNPAENGLGREETRA